MLIIKGGIATDERGSLRFVNDFNLRILGIKRFYQVQNHNKGFIRAYHGHKLEDKYVYVIKGSILFARVLIDAPAGDINHVSKIVLSDNCPRIACAPAGFYNGFMTLTEDAIVQFFSTLTLEEAEKAKDDYRLDYKTWDIWDVKNR